MKSFDVCIIGAGPGGYVAAILAGRTGKKTLLIEKENYGGTCLNVGCIPTKTLIASAEVLKTVKNSSEFGIQITGEVTFDWQLMQNRKNAVIENLRNGIGSLLKNANVEVLCGTAEFESKNIIKIKSQTGYEEKIEAEKIILATGSKPSLPKFIPVSPKILDSTGLLNISEIPKSIIILGGGVIGCEFACLLNELGSEVTIVEMLDDILPGQDLEISRQIGREMKKKKIKIMTGHPLENITTDENGVKGIVKSKEISAEYMLVAIGRIPETASLKPEKAGLNPDEKGYLKVDEKCHTNVENIFAIGDVTGRIQLAHLASAMAVAAAENACGGDETFCDCLVPSCIFTSPEIGSVGLTQEQCTMQNVDFKVGKFPYAALGKSMAINETAGFCKIIADAKTDRILGVHIIGAHATDLIAEAVTAMNKGTTAVEIGKAIHAHPTLGEIMMEAAHAVHDKSVHIPNIKKSK